jgi:hypothetical protein
VLAAARRAEPDLPAFELLEALLRLTREAAEFLGLQFVRQRQPQHGNAELRHRITGELRPPVPEFGFRHGFQREQFISEFGHGQASAAIW